MRSLTCCSTYRSQIYCQDNKITCPAFRRRELSIIILESPWSFWTFFCKHDPFEYLYYIDSSDSFTMGSTWSRYVRKMRAVPLYRVGGDHHQPFSLEFFVRMIYSQTISIVYNEHYCSNRFWRYFSFSQEGDTKDFFIYISVWYSLAKPKGSICLLYK